MKLSTFYFVHEGAFLIPIEHLHPGGLSDAYRAELQTRRGLSDPWVATFEDAFNRYSQRATNLFARAPDTWFPPRVQNICVVTDAARTRPYFQVFPDASWLLYETDFAPVDGVPALATYAFFHAERLGLTRNPVAAFVHNLSYLKILPAEERAALLRQAEASARPDAEAFRAFAALGEHMERMFHMALAPPDGPQTEVYAQLPGADLFVPKSLEPELKRFAQTVREATAGVVERYRQGQRAGASQGATDALCAWLAKSAPRALIAHEGNVVWDPNEADDLSALRDVLGELPKGAATSMQEDLRVIDEGSRRFLDAVREPARLPFGDRFEQEGGVYIHDGRHIIVYDPTERSLNRLEEAAPPYHQWLLGARVAHEWGHLAVEAGHVGVPEALRDEARAARSALIEVLNQIFAHARRGPMREVAAAEHAQVGAVELDPGDTWADLLFGRMPDYQTNLLARHFTRPEEMEAYVRVNVRNHAQDDVGPYQQLMRYAIERQYLNFSAVDDHEAYLLRSTWFEALFCEPGTVSLELARALWEAVARVCASQRIDESAFAPGALDA